jgi:GNAT superfamily N-acetyltransferase
VTTAGPRLRAATINDCAALLRLWTYLFDADSPEAEAWRAPAGEWFARFVDDSLTARFPLIEWNRQVVATAIGTLEIGVPNPHCIRGRTVRLSNVFTLPEHRGSGYGTSLVRDVIDWARSINADRVDLSTTPLGQSIYQKVGFSPTTAPRMKLIL